MGKDLKYKPDNTGISVLGGGNVGTQIACVCAEKGYRVQVISSHPECYDGVLTIVDETGRETIGRINKVSSEINEEIKDSRIIFVTYPAFKLKEAADRILPYVSPGMSICVLPGTGGAEFAFRECVEAGAALFGLQRVPSIARLEKYGKRVRCEGLKKALYLASIPFEAAADFADLLSFLFGIPCEVLANYLCVTLTPSNPLLHTTRLRTLFSDYEKGKVYHKNPLFYGEWENAASELLLACDEELQRMIGVMDQLDLREVLSLKKYYESETAEALTQKMRSIPSLHNISSPMKQEADGWVPDFQSRYFVADFPYGLGIMASLSAILGCHSPNILETMQWYRKVSGDNTTFDLNNYGIHSVDDIYDYY